MEKNKKAIDTPIEITHLRWREEGIRSVIECGSPSREQHSFPLPAIKNNEDVSYKTDAEVWANLVEIRGV